MPSKSKTSAGGRNNHLKITFNKSAIPPFSTIYPLIIRWVIIIGLALVFLSVSSSFQDHFLVPKYTAFLITSIVAGGLFVLYCLTSPSCQLTQSSLINSVILLLFFYIIASIFSEAPIISMFGSHGDLNMSLIGITAFSVLMLVASNIFTNPYHARIISWAVVVLGSIFSVVFFSAVLLLKVGPDSSELTSITVDSNATIAVFLLISASMSGALSILYETKPNKFLFGLLCVINIVPVFIMREGALGVTTLAIWSIFLFAHTAVNIPRKLIGSAVIVLIASILGVAFFKDTLVTLQDGFTSMMKVLESSIVTGTGPSLVSFVQNANVSGGLLATSFFSYLISAGGIVVLIPVALLVYFTIKISLTTIDEKEWNDYLPFVVGVMVWIILGFLVEPSAPHLITGSLMLGLLASQTSEKRRLKTSKPHSRVEISVLAVLAICTILSISVLRFSKSQQMYDQSTLEPDGYAIGTVTDAIDIYSFDPTLHSHRAVLLSNFLLNNTESADEREIIRQIKNELQISLNLNPLDPEIYTSAARAYMNLHEAYPDQNFILTSISYATIATQKNPHDPYPLVLRADILRLAGRTDSAIQDALLAMSLQDDYWPAYLSAADIAIQMKDYAKARTYLEEVAENSTDLVFKQIAESRLEGLEY